MPNNPNSHPVAMPNEFPIRPVPMTTNFFKFASTSPTPLNIYKYQVKFEPEIEVRHSRLKLKVFNRVRKAIREEYGNIVYEGNNEMYSQRNCQDEKEYQVEMKNGIADSTSIARGNS